MAVTQNTTLQAAVNGSGTKIDTVDGTGGNTVRQLVCVSSPGTAGNYQEVDANNDAQVKAILLDGKKASYRATIKNVSVGTAATTNIFTHGGSATKTIRITRIAASGTILTAAEEYDLQLVKQSTADTGGTPSTATKVPLDSDDAASAADVVSQAYTVAPTAGTAVGAIGSKKILLPIAPVETIQQIWEFGNRPGIHALVLRGVAQQVALTLNGATPGHASSWDFEVEWTEE